MKNQILSHKIFQLLVIATLAVPLFLGGCSPASASVINTGTAVPSVKTSITAPGNTPSFLARGRIIKHRRKIAVRMIKHRRNADQLAIRRPIKRKI